MSSSQSYNGGFGNGNAATSSNISASYTSQTPSSFGASSGWSSFASASAAPPVQQQQQQQKPDLSAFDSLLPLSKPKHAMAALKPATMTQQVPNFFSPSNQTTSLSNGLLMPQSSSFSSMSTMASSNVKSLSPSDINDLLSWKGNKVSPYNASAKALRKHHVKLVYWLKHWRSIVQSDAFTQ